MLLLCSVPQDKCCIGKLQITNIPSNTIVNLLHAAPLMFGTVGKGHFSNKNQIGKNDPFPLVY